MDLDVIVVVGFIIMFMYRREVVVLLRGLDSFVKLNSKIVVCYGCGWCRCRAFGVLFVLVIIIFWNVR